MSQEIAAFDVVAETGGRFREFRPYVPAINDSGAIAFQAGLAGGGTGVFVGDGGGAATAAFRAPSKSLLAVRSHPDIAADGAVAFYADTDRDGGAVVVARDGVARTVSQEAGPLGPTMSAAGVVAYRTATSVMVGDELVARAGDRFTDFDGLPVVTAVGAVAFRAERRGGGHGIYLYDAGRITAIAETGRGFARLGRFPTVNDANVVAFCAERDDGSSGVFTVSGGVRTTVYDSDGPFESFRGVLIDNAGSSVFYATPRGGTLGIYRGADPERDKVLAFGDERWGSTVRSFVLNPVSMNESRLLAVRVELADGRELVVRVGLRSG